MRFRTVIGWSIMLVLLGACESRSEAGLDSEELLSVDLAFSLSRNSDTKADVNVIPELLSTPDEPKFSGLSRVKVLPFFTGTGNPVSRGDRANGYVVELPDVGSGWDDDGLRQASLSHLYTGPEAALPSRTTSALVYACAARTAAATERAEKRLNGSLLEEGWDWQPTHHTTEDIQFLPEAIYDEELSEAAWDVADLLSGLTSLYYNYPYKYEYGDGYQEGAILLNWKDENLGNNTLWNAFVAFTGGGERFPASGILLAQRMAKLKAALSEPITDERPLIHRRADDSHEYPALDRSTGEPIKWQDLYNELRTTILTKITELESNTTIGNFPVSYGLPAGAAVFRWNDVKFVPVPEDVEGYFPATRYCYMPPLYYYVNTLVSTAYSRNVHEQFGQKTWTQILEDLYTRGKIVTHDVKAVALDSPLQYACGMVVISVRASSSTLSENAALRQSSGGDPVVLTVGDSESESPFSITGIVLGGQYRQRFDFTPITDDDATDRVLREYFLYDSQVPSLKLTTQSHEAAGRIRTLSLPTPLKQEVHFYIEFLNKSGKAFYGADGLVPVGSHFYLAGTMRKPTEEEITNGLNRVVMSDHSTRLMCTVASLENAYLTIPQYGTPELLLGIRTQVNWEFTPSSFLVME